MPAIQCFVRPAPRPVPAEFHRAMKDAQYRAAARLLKEWLARQGEKLSVVRGREG